MNTPEHEKQWAPAPKPTGSLLARWAKLTLPALVILQLHDPEPDPWGSVPESVREMLKQLGMVTPWSVVDWYCAMEHAVTSVVDKRKWQDRDRPLDREQCEQLRQLLFEEIGKLTAPQIDAIVNITAQSGRGMRVAADVFELVLDADADRHLTILCAHANDANAITLFLEDVARQGVLESFEQVTRDLAAMQKRIPPVDLGRETQHGWRMGNRLARRLGVRQ